jgi:hypothetical protein
MCGSMALLLMALAYSFSEETDLHVGSIGPGIYSAQIAVVAHKPMAPEEYKSLLPQSRGLVHIAVEVHTCTGPGLVC